MIISNNFKLNFSKDKKSKSFKKFEKNFEKYNEKYILSK